MQDIKDKFSKDIEILKKYQIEILKMKNSICQLKNLIEILSSSQDQIEDRISGLEHMVDVSRTFRKRK
jgi:hypothetical protein